MPSAKPEGALLAATREGIEGWAWDPARPYEPVDVELLRGDMVLARGVAGEFDMTLVHRHIGNGMHAFRLRLEAVPQGPYPIVLTARIADSGRPLEGQLTIAGPTELKGILAEGALHDYEGNLDGLHDGMVVGWAWDRQLPDVAVTVSLYDGAIRVSDVVADSFREDVARAGKREGRCAFAIAAPLAILDGQMHELSVRVKGTTFHLPGSPLVFGPNTARGLIELVVRLRREVDELSRKVAALTDPVGLPTRRLAEDLMQRTEAMLAIQRDALEREMRVLASHPSSRPTGGEER